MREVVLHDGEEELFAHEDDGQLDTELDKTASRRTLLLAPVEDPVKMNDCSKSPSRVPIPGVLVGSPYKQSLEESDVEDRSVVVNKLEQVNFKRESVVEVCLSSVELLLCEPHCHGLVDVVEYQDEDQVYASPSHGDEERPVALDSVVTDCGQGHDHGHPVEDDGEDCDQGEEYEEDDTAP